VAVFKFTGKKDFWQESEGLCQVFEKFKKKIKS